jgi:hypothetical protein
MAHIDILMQVTLPNGEHYSRESTPNKDPNRLDRRISSYLRKQGVSVEDVITVMSTVNKNTGILARFTYRCRNKIWDLEVSVRCFKNSICPVSEWYTNLTYQDTRDITKKFTIDYLG